MLKYKPLCIIVALFLLIIVLYLCSDKSVHEGLANNNINPSQVAKSIKNDIVVFENALNIKHNSQEYDEILTDVTKWCNLAVLDTIVTNKLKFKNGVDTTNTELITSLNQYMTLQQSLFNIQNNILP